MRYLLISMISAMLASAGPLDFVTLKKAKEAYERGDYETAAGLYGEIAKAGSEEATFDAADALYKSGRYKEALKLYESVSSPKLEFEKLHNMGNCYAQLGKIDKGIESYEAALKIKEDSDTRFNLELLKKMKEQKKNQNRNDQKNNQSKQNRKNQDDQKSGNGDQNRKNQKSGHNRQNDRQPENGRNQKEKNRNKGGEKSRNDQNKKSGSAKKEKNESGKQSQPNRQERAMTETPKQNEPISEMEVRKWNRVLNRRGIHTLMLPLPTKKAERSSDETTPW